MGVTVWFFLRSHAGELRPLPGTRLDAFMSGKGRLTRDPEGFVRYVQVLVNLQDRRAVEVLSLGFFQYRAHEDGRLDREYLRQIMAVISEAAFGSLRLSKPPPGVVGAEHKFARRRLEHLSQWKPTRDDLAMLRDVVNRKAGTKVL